MSITRVLLAGFAIMGAGLTPLVAQTVDGFDHPESVFKEGNALYVSNLGKELKPSDKDGDGYISKLDLSGKVIDKRFLPKTGKLNAPKGMAAIGNVLYVTDVDRVIGFDLTSREQVFSVDVPGTVFLNDPVMIDARTLWVSATDKNQLVRIDLDKKTVEFLPISGLNGPNGLTLSDDKETVYNVGFGVDNKPNGTVVKIDVASLKSERIGTYEGLLDGVYQRGNKLYFSDWKSFGDTGELQVLDLKSGQTARATDVALIGGFADFLVDGNQLTVPSLTNNKIIFTKFN